MARTNECVACGVHLSVYDEYYEIAKHDWIVCTHCLTYRHKIVLPEQFRPVKDEVLL